MEKRQDARRSAAKKPQYHGTKERQIVTVAVKKQFLSIRSGRPGRFFES